MEIKKPETVPKSRRANKAQVAEWYGVSLPTIEAWLRKGMPVAQRGSRGFAWVFDLMDVAEWKFGGRAVGDDADHNPEKLAPAERKAWYDGEKARRDLQIRDRELIPADEVERVTATAFSSIAQTIRGIPDLLERRLALEPEVLSEIEKIHDEALNELADSLECLAPAAMSEVSDNE